MTANPIRVSAGLLLNEFPFVRIGSGSRPLLVIPGAEVSNADPGVIHQQALRAAFADYAHDHCVYIVHRKRGLPPTTTTADLAGDYIRVLRAVAPDGGPAHVMGLSTGGLIAQHLAGQAPEEIDRLVLALTAAHLSPEGRRLVEQWCELARTRQWIALYAAMSEVLVTGATSKRLIRGFIHVFGRLVVSPPRYPDDFIVTMNAVLAHDTTALLPTLRMPTLVLAGDLDPFFPAPLLHETAALIPHATLTVYQGAGHGLTKLHKRRFAHDVLEFLTPTSRMLRKSHEETVGVAGR